MGLFDLFSNDTAEQAAAQRNQGLQQGYDALSTTFGQGRDALTSSLGQGRDAATSAYGNAGNIYQGLGQYFQQQYGGGAQAYGDATGANGAAGFGRAQSNFQSDPGYQFQMDQGLQALQRTHAAAGNLASGNADADTLKYSQGLADQSYGNYVSRLAPYLQLSGAGATTAAAGQADASSHLGNTLNTNYTAQGTGLNADYTAQGQAANANYTGQGASNAAATMNNYNVGANQLSALMGVGGLALGAMGGGAGSGLTSGLGSLFGSFGGGAAPGSYGGAAQNYGQTYNIGYGGQNVPVF